MKQKQERRRQIDALVDTVLAQTSASPLHTVGATLMLITCLVSFDAFPLS